MFNLMHELFKDKDTGVFTFSAFSLCHIIYLLLIIGGIILVIFLYKNKTQEAKTKLITTTVTIAFALYIADFFLMPFATCTIDIGKLPFHLCTLMSVMCFVVRHNKKMEVFKTAFTLLGLIGGLMYITYPAGVAQADGYSYRIVQTVIYHGLMIAQGVFALVFDDLDLSWKNFKYDVIAVLAVAVWAYIGNTLYSGSNFWLSYENDFNWFFVKHDGLYLIDDEKDAFIAPLMSVSSVLAISALLRLIAIKLKSLFVKEQVLEAEKEA